MPDKAEVRAIDRSELKRQATFDAGLSLVRVLGGLVSDDEEVWQQARIVAALVETYGDEDRAATVADIELTPEIGLVLMSTYVYHEAWNAVLRLATVVEPSDTWDGDDVGRLHWIWACAAGLAYIEHEDAEEDEARWSAPGLAADFRRLAAVEHAAGHTDTALACALSAVNLAGESADTEGIVEFALRLAAEADDAEAAFSLRTRAALALARACDEDPALAAAAFDQCESALRHAAWAGRTADAPVLALMQAVHDAKELNGLRGLALGARGLEHDNEEFRHALEAFARPCWDATLDEMAPLLNAIRTIAVGHEDKRLGVMSILPDPDAAEASWGTWGFDLPAFRRSIPHGLSMRRTPGLDETMLIIAHETIHVLSMVGALGVAAAALRLALLEVEFRLWTFAGPVDPEEVRLVGVAPLVHGNLDALPQAEQALELSRKLRTLEEVWAPWFEGVALLGEIAVTKPDDPFDATVTQVIANLVDDEALDVKALQREVMQQELERRQHEADRAFFEAGRALGPARLNYILQRHPGKYLGGYLAVRGLLSAWRASTDDDLDLPTAFRAMLHMTRHGTAEAIPDLALPAEEFREQAVELMCAWVGCAARVDPAAFQAFRHPDDAVSSSWSWSGDRLEMDVREPLMVDVRPMVERALLTLVGEHADRERVPEPDAGSAELIEAAAESLALQRWSLVDVDPDLADRMLSRVTVLPIGRCRALFWLTSDDCIVTLLRIADGPSDEANARHQLLTMALPEKAARELREEMGRRREARLSVVRFADLSPYEEFPNFRGGGTNYLAFVYGSWVHITHRGMLMGARAEVAESLLAAVTARLLPSPLLDMESAHTWSGAAGAERTLRWLDRSDDWTVDGHPYDAPALVAHVKATAETLLQIDHRDDSEYAATRMLSLLVSEAQAESLQREGLRAVRSLRREYPGELVSVLAATAFEPAESAFLDEAWPSLEERIGPLFVHTAHGWDVRPIAEAAS